jgi:hypothetical protein
VRKQQRQQLGLVTVLLPETGLQLGAGEEKLLATWEVGLGLAIVGWVGTRSFRSMAHHLGLRERCVWKFTRKAPLEAFRIS